MLRKYTPNTLHIDCLCEKSYTHVLNAGKSFKFMQEFGEYENLFTECPHCGRHNIFNMNIELDEFDYTEIERLGIPNKEVNQRKYVRDIIQMFREDFKV